MILQIEHSVCCSTRLGGHNLCNCAATLQATVTHRQDIEWLEKYVFYVDTRGYIALKPSATANWQELKSQVEEVNG